MKQAATAALATTKPGVGLNPLDKANPQNLPDLQSHRREFPVITVPTITLEGDANGAPHPDAPSYRKKFSGKYSHQIIKGGVGHNPPQEAPQAFADAVVEVDGY